MEIRMRFFKKLGIELLYDAAIPLLGTYLKESKTTYNKLRYLHTEVYQDFIIIHNSQVMESA
jgi:hypothetical protein